MESLAYILVMGIERTEVGNVRLTAQVGLPSQETGGEGPIVNLLVAEGRDLSEAVDNMYLQSTKRPNLNHLRLIVISEEMAEEGIWPTMDFFRRDIRIRLNTKVAVSPDDMDELLEVEEPLSSQPALAIIDQFNINAERSRLVRTELMDLVSDFLEPDREAALPLIEVGEDRFRLGRTAVFKGDRQVATADKDETLGLLLWQNRVRSGVITMPQIGESQIVSFRIHSSRTEVRVSWENDRLHVQVNVTTTLDVNELYGVNVADLESTANHYIINRMNDVLKIAQREGTDFIGLSARFRRENPQVWASQQDNWDEVLANAQVDLRSRTKIRRQGQIP